MRHPLAGVPAHDHSRILAAEATAMTTRWPLRIAVAFLIYGAVAFTTNGAVLACTAFCAAGRGGQVLVGNNEDWTNPRTKIWFVPAKPGAYGRVYVGFDDLWPQGGMNERGLWFDGFATPAIKAADSTNLPRFPGNIVDAAMAECSTVEEVVALFSRYDRAFLIEGILMFADASGDAVSIERNAMVRKTSRHFVQTNFHQSRAESAEPDARFTTASDMLARAGDEISIDLFRRILAATHQRGGAPTLYSNVYDLQSRTMHLYYFHDFERMVTFNLADELKKGARVLDIPALFPPNAAAEAFIGRQRDAARRQSAGRIPGGAVITALVAVPLIFIALTVYGWIHAGRRFRIGVSALVGVLALCVLAIALTLGLHRPTSAPWMTFSIGPAAGQSTSINAGRVKSDGISLQTAVATAYDMPSVRVLGPRWLHDTRYSLEAVVGVDESDAFRSMLRQELKNRLQLQTHRERRPFDVLVLTATDAPRLERALGHNVSIWVSDRDARFQEASMERLAGVLQNILGKPVVDETGITGSYNLELEWNADRVASVTAALHDRYGLRLSPGTRELEALIVEQVRRDAAMVLLAEIGRATRAAPPSLRRRIAEILTIH